MKISAKVETTAGIVISTPNTDNPANQGRLIRRLWIVTIFVVLASIRALSAQPAAGTAPTSPLDTKELDDFLASQLSQKPFVGISVALVQGGKVTSAKGTVTLQRNRCVRLTPRRGSPLRLSRRSLLPPLSSSCPKRASFRSMIRLRNTFPI
jgi:hypothetical protein